MAAPVDKQAALAKSIADAVALAIRPDIAAMSEKLVMLEVKINTILAKTEMAMSATAEPKRAVKTGAAGAKKVVAKKPEGETVAISNAMLYFKHALSNDLPIGDSTYRRVYGTAENIALVAGALTKHDKEKKPADYWGAFASSLWKTALGDPVKDTLRAELSNYNQKLKRDTDDAPLEEDPETAEAEADVE